MMKSSIDYSKYKESLNPLKDAILWNKSFPDIKEFPQKYKKGDIVPDSINIRKISSEYFNELNTLDTKAHEILISIKKLKETLSKEFLHHHNINKGYYNNIDKTLSVIMGKNFDNLKPKVRLHINVFCYLFTVIEKEFVNKLFVEYDINIIYWAILFHDIGKFIKMHPILEKSNSFTKGDRMHPYKSALIFIDTLLDKKLIKIEQKELDIFCEKYSKFKKKIYDSYMVKEPKSMKFYINIECFNDIIKFIKYLRSLGEDNSWFCDAFILIIFHQNLPNNEYKMNKELLSKEQIMDVFDLRLLEMMRIIMILDSLSHQIFNPTEWTSQINMNLDNVRKYFIQDNK